MNLWLSARRRYRYYWAVYPNMVNIDVCQCQNWRTLVASIPSVPSVPSIESHCPGITREDLVNIDTRDRGVTAQTHNVFRSSILFHQAFPRLPKKQYILVFAHLTCMPSQDKNKHHIWISNEVHILHIEGHCVCFLSKIYDVFQRWSWGNMNAKGDKELSKTVFHCK